MKPDPSPGIQIPHVPQLHLPAHHISTQNWAWDMLGDSPRTSHILSPPGLCTGSSSPGSALLALLTLATWRPLLALGEDQELPQLLAPSLPRRLCLVSCPHSSAGEESACSAGDLRWIPGLGGSLGRRKWQSTAVFLPGESHGQRSLEGYSLWGCKSQIRLSD